MKKKAISLLLAGILTFSMGTPVFATESEIADMQAQKQEAESNLAQTQSDISSMESKKQELESYLADLNTQYEELTNTISELSIQAGEKENQLKQIRAELKKAKKAEKKQYEDMKLRIQYMYENGGTSALETLLSSKDLAEFLNNAESVSKISQYDRNMLDQYVNLQNNIQEQDTAAEEEKQSIDALLAERSSKKQEVQELTASTSDNIASYVDQISASQEEAAALTEQINNADNSIALLVQQAEEEKAAREAAEAKAAEEAAEAKAAEEAAAQAEESNDAEESSSQDEDTSEDYVEDTVSEDISEDTSDEEYTEETDSSDDSEDADTSSDSEAASEEQTSSESSDSSQGKYLGNFTLTAYCNCAQCCGTAGNLTASGTVPTAGRTVAMAGVPFGTQLLINGTVYTVEDLGTPYGHVDIYFDNHSDALSFGLQTAEVYQLN